MKHFLSLLLLAFALTASAQGLKFSNTEGLFTEEIPLNELKSIEHSIDENGQGLVTVESLNGAIYTNPVDNVQYSSTSREEVFASDKFADMIYVKEFERLDQLKLGDFIGVFHEEDYEMDTFLAKANALVNYMLNMIPSSEDSSIDIHKILDGLIDLRLNSLAQKNETERAKLRVHISDIVYVGEDKNGNKVPLSARLIYPYIEDRNDMNLTKMYVENHVTVFAKNTEPTATLSIFTSCGVLTYGYLVVQPDLIGWGTTRDRTQMYIDKDINGSAIAYSVVASQQFAEWAAEREEYGFKLSSSAPIINAGSSQGASSAISGTYFIENKLDKKAYPNFPAIEENRLCAGAYNMKVCLDKFCEEDDLIYACKVPMLVAGAFAAHADDFYPYTVHDYFNPLMKTYSYTSVDDKTKVETPCGTAWQILDLKQHGSFAVEGCLAKIFPSDVTPGTPSFRKMLADDCFTTSNGKNVLNWNNAKMKLLQTFLATQNFADKSLWTPKSKIELVHADNDDIIPFDTANEFYNNQNYRKGLTNIISFSKLSGVPIFVFQSSSYAVHMITCFIWTVSEYYGVSPTIVNTALKAAFSSSEK